MNYQDIKTFLTIVSSSSLSKAAEVLFVSQPALSHRLSALEEELGTELIIRKKGSRTLELTDAGQRFVPLARKWEKLRASWRQARSSTRNHRTFFGLQM